MVGIKELASLYQKTAKSCARTNFKALQNDGGQYWAAKWYAYTIFQRAK